VSGVFAIRMVDFTMIMIMLYNAKLTMDAELPCFVAQGDKVMLSFQISSMLLSPLKNIRQIQDGSFITNLKISNNV
jgi:hypothetical protein